MQTKEQARDKVGEFSSQPQLGFLHQHLCLICFWLRAVHNSLIYIIWSDHSGVFWLLAHVPSQLLLQVVEVLALPLHCHPGQLSSPQVVPQCIGRLHLFAFCQSRLLNIVLLLNEPLLSLDFCLKILYLLLPLLSVGLVSGVSITRYFLIIIVIKNYSLLNI